MKNKRLVEKVRAFNRFYMPAMKLLGNRYLGSEYSVTEARIFFEIYEREGCNAAHIAETMQIDKSYLSKIITAHEKNGYLQRTPSLRDKRSYDLFLTEKGKIRAEEFIAKSNEEIKAILKSFSEGERLKMERALDDIIEILKKHGGDNENSSL